MVAAMVRISRATRKLNDKNSQTGIRIILLCILALTPFVRVSSALLSAPIPITFLILCCGFFGR